MISLKWPAGHRTKQKKMRKFQESKRKNSRWASKSIWKVWKNSGAEKILKVEKKLIKFQRNLTAYRKFKKNF